MTRSIRFTGSARLLRGTVLGCATVLITVLGHAGGHGSLPEPGLLLLLAPLALALGALVADKRRSAAWMLGYVLAVQVLFHLLLTIASGHGHHGSVIPDTAMLLGHLLAALAVTIVLIHGDALIHRWIEFWRALAIELSWTPLSEPVTVAVAFVEPVAAVSATLDHDIARRGPPVS